MQSMTRMGWHRKLLLATGTLVMCGGGLASSTAAHASGPAANQALTVAATQLSYSATPETTNPDTEPVNGAAPYTGAPLVLQSSITGREAGEPTIGINKKGTVFIPGDTFDSTGGALARNIELKTTDHGVTFKDISPNVAGVNTHPVTLDTITYVDKTYGRLFTLDTTAAAGSLLSFSDDEGATYTTTMALAAGVNDHQTVVTGVVPPGSPLITLDPKFPKLVYYCVNTVAAVSCSRSLDGGVSFIQMNSPFPLHIAQSLPLSGLCSSLVGHMVTDPAGNLYVPSAFNEIAGCGQPQVAVSHDAGNTWTQAFVNTNINDPYNNVGLASDTAGNIYSIWQDDKHNLPYMSVSRNQGAQWSTPVMVAPPGVRVSNFPAIDAGDPGRVAISFPGSADALANTDNTKAPWQYYVAFSNDALAPSPHFVSQVTQIANGPGTTTTTMHRGACNGRCGGLFDFLDVKVAPTAGGPGWAALSDDCTGPCGTPGGGVSNDPSAGMGLTVEEISGPAQLGSGMDLGPPAGNVPETPMALLLPLAAVSVGVGMIVQRRRAGRGGRMTAVR
ncbi:MAG: hypothetical protein JF887_06995 [Candidatus Dormibacteraeota bacterium]|uniref:Exo-alpha-sialidase n=1 Tax=Candidatus Amunia macphersoniae TaxID=3127014 RepID=A0A934KEU0_9BACT|nr:hypothetical protein [Candidatus Dormibacteraeota bacterium]